MRSFEQKAKGKRPAARARSRREPPTGTNALLDLQNTVGNQAVQRIVTADAANPKPKTIQRSPEAKPVEKSPSVPQDLLLWSTAVWPKKLDSEQWILMLAANPDHAHQRWSKLPLTQQLGVLVYMERFYGKAFAAQFASLHSASKPTEAGFEQVGADIPPASLSARGFQLAGVQSQMNVEIWFHPSGSRLHRVMPVPPPPEPEPPEEDEELEDEEEEIDEDEDEEDETIPVEEAILTDGQKKALRLLQQMERLNQELQGYADANPPMTSEFMDREHDFTNLRRRFSRLFRTDESVRDPEFDFLRTDRQKAIDTFMELRKKVYGTDVGDWENIEQGEPGSP